MPSAPLYYTWQGDSFQPLPRFAKQADKLFVVGETYRLEVNEERSQASHNHFFAALADAHGNLPQHLADRWPTVEHLRKYSLVRCGYADQRQHVCASKAEALRLRAFIAPMDEYAIVEVTEAVVTVWTAQSQSRKAMGGKVFQKSKSDVLDYVASLIGADADQLGKAA